MRYMHNLNYNYVYDLGVDFIGIKRIDVNVEIS